MLWGLIFCLLAVLSVFAGPVSADEAGLIQDETYDMMPAGESGNISGQNGMAVQEAEVEQILSAMTMRDKIAQMFVVTPESLTGYEHVTAAEEATRAAVSRLPVGGLIYMGANLESTEQITRMLSNTMDYSMERIGLPMILCIDEEGGSVRRISGRGIADAPDIPSMRSVGDAGDAQTAFFYGEQMGRYLSALGFNVDLAPVADTLTEGNNQVVADRSFGWDPQMNAAMCTAVMQGLHEYGVASTFKHFPGHGSTSEDSHAGYAVSYQTMEDLLSCDLIPFQAGVDNGTELIMTGHISLPNVTGDDTPATLSHMIVTGILRERMGYEGLIITDALEMGAITQNYSSGEAAIRSIEAGNDLILEPADPDQAYRGVLNAVESGRISEERINESLRRIIRFKLMIRDRDAGTL